MGADYYQDPPRDNRKLWEKVRDQEEELARMRKNVYELSAIIDKKNEEIRALQAAIRSMQAG